MLKGISPFISPELIKILMEMGHGDEIVLADANFPAVNYAKRLIRCDGVSIIDLLPAILELFPLDTYSENSYMLMQVVDGDICKTDIWDSYGGIVKKHNSNKPKMIERFDFYERTKNAFAIVATGEKAQYANIIIKKGVVK